jgi:hypothetical protein
LKPRQGKAGQGTSGPVGAMQCRSWESAGSNVPRPGLGSAAPVSARWCKRMRVSACSRVWTARIGAWVLPRETPGPHFLSENHRTGESVAARGNIPRCQLGALGQNPSQLNRDGGAARNSRSANSSLLDAQAKRVAGPWNGTVGYVIEHDNRPAKLPTNLPGTQVR